MVANIFMCARYLKIKKNSNEEEKNGTHVKSKASPNSKWQRKYYDTLILICISMIQSDWKWWDLLFYRIDDRNWKRFWSIWWFSESIQCFFDEKKNERRSKTIHRYPIFFMNTKCCITLTKPKMVLRRIFFHMIHNIIEDGF